MSEKLASGGSAGKKARPRKHADDAAPTCCDEAAAPSFNAATIKAIEDVRAGIDVTEYTDEVELFEKMGIEVGKAKTKA